MKTTRPIFQIFGSTFLVASLLTGCGDNDKATAGSDAAEPSAASTATTPDSGVTVLRESEHPLKEIKITGNDQMKFSTEAIKALPGQPLKVIFENIGTVPKASMGHNWVLIKKGTDAAAFAEAGFASAGNDYINPDDNDKVLAKTAILGPGESETVTINAPSEPGEFPYLCTFPGHFAVGMKGVLVVE